MDPVWLAYLVAVDVTEVPLPSEYGTHKTFNSLGLQTKVLNTIQVVPVWLAYLCAVDVIVQLVAVWLGTKPATRKSL